MAKSEEKRILFIFDFTYSEKVRMVSLGTLMGRRELLLGEGSPILEAPTPKFRDGSLILGALTPKTRGTNHKNKKITKILFRHHISNKKNIFYLFF